MANPLLLLLGDAGGRRRRRRRLPVPVPREMPSTDAIFVMLRRLRTPLVVLVLILTISVVGLTLIPNADGSHLSVLDAFYFATYTAATIGYGELVEFTPGQRMWVTFTIYLSVVGWAYAIGTSLSLLQDATVREAFATHRFARRVRTLREDFVIVVGYGRAGRQVVLDLDAHGHRVVVVDDDPDAINRLGTESLATDVPGLEANGAVPGVLGLAGMGSSRCVAVLALTDDDNTNLAVVMAGSLLRPDVPVITRCRDRVTAERMRGFDAGAVIQPSDKFGEYLVLAMERPSTYRLVTSLMSEGVAHEARRPPVPAHGRWVVAGDEEFTEEVANDLRADGRDVDVVDPSGGRLGVEGAVGFIVGTTRDTLNLALAAQARDENPDLFVAVRQETHSHRAMLEALGVDAVYAPADLVANEALARIVTPLLWGFVEHVLAQDDAWSERLLERLVTHCGETSPERRLVTLDRRGAPGATRWIRHSPLTVADLERHPDDRDTALPLTTLLIVRGDETIYAPDDDAALREGDQLLVAGTHRALEELVQILDYDSVVEYVATGRRVPDGWLWRRLTRTRGRGDARRTPRR